MPSTRSRRPVKFGINRDQWVSARLIIDGNSKNARTCGRFSWGLMMKLPMLNRFHAFGWHMLASSCVALICSALVFLLWYPGQLALASGVSDIFLLLLVVDVTLGPVITMVVFNPKKKELRRDLAMVVVVQLAALLYGLHTVYTARPVYIVFSIDRFDLVFANDFTEENLAKATNTEYQSLPLFRPKVVAARTPDDTNAHNELLFNSISGGADLPQLPQYYVPYTEFKADVIKRIYPLAELKAFNPNKLSAVDSLAGKYAGARMDIGYLPLKGKAQDLVVILNRTTGEVLEMVDLMPWK